MQKHSYASRQCMATYDPYAKHGPTGKNRRWAFMRTGSDANVSQSTWTKLPLVQLMAGDYYDELDSGNSKYIVGLSGVYHISITIYFYYNPVPSGNMMNIGLYVNGSIKEQRAIHQGRPRYLFCTLIPLSAGDEIEVYAYHDYAATVSGHASSTMQIGLLGK